jgi:predicted nucleic acid-binding protein
LASDRLPRIFLDTSAFFSAVFSEKGGARELLRLGERDAVRLLVSQDVLAELEDTVRAKAPRRLNDLAVLLLLCGFHVVPPPEISAVQDCLKYVSYSKDAVVLAAASRTEVDYFVTLDRKHFLLNTALREAMSFPIGTPGDCLSWLHARSTN